MSTGRIVALAQLGLRLGEPIRFRRNERGHWIVGRVEAVEADGSVTLRDPDGAARSLRPERLEIRRPGSRGRLRWCVVSEVAVTWEQLELFDAAAHCDDVGSAALSVRRTR